MPKPDAARTRSYNGDYMNAGKAAEEIASDYLWNLDEVAGVDDVRSVKSWQERDIDFIATLVDGSVRYYDAKSDVHMGVSSNVLFEILRINHTNPLHMVALGWSVFSSAHEFLVWNPSLETLYAIKAKDLRSGFNAYVKDERKRIRIDVVPTDEIKSTVNVLVPIRYVPFVAYQREAWSWTRIYANQSS